MREITLYNNQHMPEPYASYIQGRNGKVAEYIAPQLSTGDTPYYIPWRNFTI